MTKVGHSTVSIPNAGINSWAGRSVASAGSNWWFPGPVLADQSEASIPGSDQSEAGTATGGWAAPSSASHQPPWNRQMSEESLHHLLVNKYKTIFKAKNWKLFKRGFTWFWAKYDVLYHSFFQPQVRLWCLTLAVPLPETAEAATVGGLGIKLSIQWLHKWLYKWK